METPGNKLKSIFDDPVWKQEQRMQVLARLRRRLWNFAGVLALIVAVLFFANWFRDKAADFIMGIIVLVILLLVVQFIASILGALCALFPIKDYHYNDRLEGWIPLWTIIVEGIIILLFVSGFFLEFW